ncbi:MAG: hypothetical protein E7192_05230 [Erysipelotrichaceae bacterium]|nr:hypothetical protein [Erysipelotrichaceae bacterium]
MWNKLMKLIKNKKSLMMISLVLLLTVSTGGTFAYLIEKTPTVINTFKSGIDPYGSVQISKKIDHPYGSSYSVPSGLSFSFDVNVGLELAGTQLGNYSVNDSGIIQITLEDGESVTIPEIPENTVVTVTETSSRPGFSAESDTLSTTVEPRKNQILPFTNIYIPSIAPCSSLNVTGIKHIEGREWLDTDSFTFIVEYKMNGTDTWTTLGSSVVVDHQSNYIDESTRSFDLTSIVQSAALSNRGTYLFRLTETNVPGYMIPSVDSFAVVTDDIDMDGFLEISQVMDSDNIEIPLSNSQYSIELDVTNAYQISGDTGVRIDITKIFEDASNPSVNRIPSGFVFVLDDGTNQIESNPTGLDGTAFFMLDYIAEDAGKIFTYLLSEKNTGDSHIDYDDKQIKVHVHVRDNGDGSVSAVIFECTGCDLELGEYTPVVIFNNEPSTPEPSLEPVVSSEPTASPVTTSDPAVTATPEASLEPAVSSEPVVLNEPIICTVPENGSSVFTVSFKNLYTPDEALLTISGQKTYNKSFDDNMFEFTLVQTDSSFNVIEHGKEYTVSNIADGFSFTDIAFSQVGTEYYLLKEKIPAEAVNGVHKGITYDPTEYQLEIQISEDTSNPGTLKAELIDPIEYLFNNTYDVSPVQIEITASKTFTGTGADNRTDEFYIDIYESNDDSFTVLNKKDTKSIVHSGDVKFEFELSEPKDYYYVLKENTDRQADGVIYDESQFYITLHIKDNLDGTMSYEIIKILKVMKDGSSEEVTSVTFENKYHPESIKHTFTGKKTLENATLMKDQFTFELYRTDDSYDLTGITCTSTKNDAEGMFSFTETYEHTGTYWYVVKETDEHDSNPLIQYDSTQYGIKTVVEDKNGHLEVTEETIIDLTDGQQAQLRFHNIAEQIKPDDISITLNVKKTVKNTGTESRGPEGFVFILEKDGTEIAKAISDEDGNAYFTLILSERDLGSSSYRIVESHENEAYVTYSTNVYDFDIEVQKEQNILKSKIIYKGAETDALTAEFENIYHHVIKQPNAANTSDDSHLMEYALTCALSLIMMIFMILFRKKLVK